MSKIDKEVMAVFENLIKSKNDQSDLVLYGNKIKINGFGNFRSFLSDLHDFLRAHDFVDILEPGIRTIRPNKAGVGENVLSKAGELANVDDYSRHNDMYERLFRDVELANGNKEYEVEWEAISHLKDYYLPNSYFFFKFKVVNRSSPTKEFVENGKKIKKQGGTWEFESKYIYRCWDLAKELDVPILNKFGWSKKFYYKRIFGPLVEIDIEMSKELTRQIKELPLRYFSQFGNS